MQTRNKARFLAVNRMTRKCFRNLCRLLISDKGGLKARNTISIEEKIMTSIQVLKGHTTRVIYEMFQHSSSTVSHIHTYEDPYEAAVFWAFRPPLSLIRSLHRFLKHFLVILFTARNLALLRVAISSLVNITRVVMESCWRTRRGLRCNTHSAKPATILPKAKISSPFIALVFYHHQEIVCFQLWHCIDVTVTFGSVMGIEGNEFVLKNALVWVSNDLYVFVVIMKLRHEVSSTLLNHLSLRVVIEEDCIWCGMALVGNRLMARSRLSDIFQRHRMLSRSWRWRI